MKILSPEYVIGQQYYFYDKMLISFDISMAIHEQ